MFSKSRHRRHTAQPAAIDNGKISGLCVTGLGAQSVEDKPVYDCATRTSAAERCNFRSIWISDVHLGMRHTQVDALLDFLRRSECRNLYIVGDLIDGWQLKRKWFWSDNYNELIQKLLRKSGHDTRLTYITGNHDEFLEVFGELRFGSLTLAQRAIHTGADGRRYLVIHGHQSDGLTHFNRQLEHVGARIYNGLLYLNAYFNRVRRVFGFGYWSLAAYLKAKAKSAVKETSDFERLLAHMARNENAAGVICGHIHRAKIETVDGILYMNCGDWVESCTALVEDLDGTFRLLHLREDLVQPPRREPESKPGENA
jgi:UDP-2,3-diacylglucosamine pyrophosphatase LpxH